jgi:hypothetical protein
MIKAWLVADFLRQNPDPPQWRLNDLQIAIIDSDNDAGERTYDADGYTASIDRLISMCGLTDTTAVPYYWSNTEISARDTVRMGECIANGTAAGPKWTTWVLTQMRNIQVGDFGIREALPSAVARTVAIKNGWLLRDDGYWHVACMAIGDTWVMSVLQRYQSTGGANDFPHTEQVCQDTATQLLNPDASG